MSNVFRAALAACAFLACGNALALEDQFMCADGFLVRETSDSQFGAGCMAVDAVSVGYTSVPAVGPGSPQGRFGPVTVTLGFAKNAARLAQAAGTGAEIPVPVVLSSRRGTVTGSQVYATLTLEHARVSEVQMSFSGGDDGTIRVVLRASKITYTVRPINADGSLGPPVTVPWEATP